MWWMRGGEAARVGAERSRMLEWRNKKKKATGSGRPRPRCARRRRRRRSAAGNGPLEGDQNSSNTSARTWPMSRTASSGHAGLELGLVLESPCSGLFLWCFPSTFWTVLLGFDACASAAAFGGAVALCARDRAALAPGATGHLFTGCSRGAWACPAGSRDIGAVSAMRCSGTSRKSAYLPRRIHYHSSHPLAAGKTPPRINYPPIVVNL